MSQHLELRVEDDDVVEAFFSQPPPAVEIAAEPWEPRPMTAGERKAMRATFAMLGFFAVVSVCLAAYAELAMVKPAPLSAAGLPPRPASSAPTEAEPRSAAPATQQVPQAAIAPQIALPGREVQEPTAHRPAAPLPGAKRPLVRESAGSDRAGVRGSAPMVEATTKRAYAQLKQGHPADAIYLATQAIGLDPSRASAYIALAGAREAIGDHAGARAAFRDCTERAQDRLASACKTLAR